MNLELTSAEMAILTLLREGPRHGYDLERLIEARGVREWTDIGFSSIYYLLNRLAKRGLAAPVSDAPAGKSRRPFAITEDGQRVLREAALRAIAQPSRTNAGPLLGIANWPILEGDRAAALAARADKLTAELDRLRAARARQAAQPDFVAAMFDYATGQIEADLEWTQSMMKTTET